MAVHYTVYHDINIMMGNKYSTIYNRQILSKILSTSKNSITIMPRILVLGATGYLGNQIAKTLRRTGQHTVFALTRSSASSSKLARDELIPVICQDPINDKDALSKAILVNRIDLIIDSTSAYGDGAKMLSTIVTVGEEMVAGYQASGIEIGPKLGYIYISGAWVHGETSTEASDLDQVGVRTSEAPALDMVSWRPDLERQVLASRRFLDVMILRPATMYGRTSPIWGAIFGPILSAVAENKRVARIQVLPTARSSLVHVDDVAEAATLGATQLSILSGTGVFPVFNLSSSVENISNILEAFKTAIIANSDSVGSLQLELVGPGEDIFLKALGSSVQVSSARARQLLNWCPKRLGFAQEMNIYAEAWKTGL